MLECPPETRKFAGTGIQMATDQWRHIPSCVISIYQSIILIEYEKNNNDGGDSRFVCR